MLSPFQGTEEKMFPGIIITNQFLKNSCVANLYELADQHLPSSTSSFQESALLLKVSGVLAVFNNTKKYEYLYLRQQVAHSS